MGIIRVFIERPIFLLMIELFFLVIGIIGYTRLGVDQFPDIQPPIMTITTEYPGAGPEEIESLVTKVIEDEVNQIGGIERLVSTSRQGLSQIVVEFELHIDAKEAQIDVRDKLSRARAQLPKDIEEPLLQRLDFADRPIFQLALRNKEGAGNRASEARLFKIADEKIEPLLQQIDGVGQVNLFGGREREIQINIDLEKLKTWKITPSEIAVAIRQSNVNVPSGEFTEYPTSRSIRVLGEYAGISDIENTVVKTLAGGRTILIKDVAQVSDTYKKRQSFARLNDDYVVLLDLKKVSDGNTVAVAERILKTLPVINQQLPQNLEIVPVYDGSSQIRMSLYDVIETMVIAAILAVVVVYLFLGSWQSTFITGISLPTVIINSFFVLYLFDFTLNIMTLLGLTLSVGLLLDDAILVRENIWRKIEQGLSPKLASMEGTREVYLAVISSSLTLLATFLPVLLIPGIVGKFFAAFALTVCICVILSTLDALAVAPTLSALMVTKKSEEPVKWLVTPQKIGRRILYYYEILLRLAMRHPVKTVTLSLVVFFSSLILPKYIGFTFLPEDDSGEIEISFEAPPGTTIYKTDEIAREIVEVVKEFKDVVQISTSVGSELNEENVARIYMKLAEEKDRVLTTSEIKVGLNRKLDLLSSREGLSKTIAKPGGGGGQGKPVQLIVEGPDNDVLTALANEIIRKTNIDIPGIINMESNLKPGRDEWQLNVRRSNLSAFGLTTDMLGGTLRGLYQGELAGAFREDGEEYDIRVQLPEDAKLDIDSLSEMTLTNIRGEEIPILAVVEPIMGKSPTKLVRIDQKRAARIEGDITSDTPLGDAITNLVALVSPMLSEGYSIRFQGSAESMEDLRVGAILAIFLGGLFTYMIMAALYESLLIPFSVLMTLPMAVVGAFLGLLMAGRFLDIYSIIGLILLMGLVGKNAIVLVDYAQQLMEEGKEMNEALIEAGVRRFRPIMMTVISTIAGMLPIAMGMGELNKFRSGMGIAAIGGLISSTMLSLVVVPCLYVVLIKAKLKVVQGLRRLFRLKEGEVPLS